MRLSRHRIVCDRTNSTLTTDVIRVPHNDDVRVERLQGMLCPPRRHVHCLSNLGTEQTLGGVNAGSTRDQVRVHLLVYDNVYFDPSFSLTLKDSVETVAFIQFAWPP
jgi:hypothetical protein